MQITSIRVSEYKGSSIKPMTKLDIDVSEIIKLVIIPFFNSMTWHSKKFLDFEDWKRVFMLKEKGLQHTEHGLKAIDEILMRMNNKRLSNSRHLLVDRESI
uniref:Truncated LAGLIDADG endonuclease n=1 Tax=Sclerotinia borealis TaxID=77105 RepID=A0A088CS07_9HELO|nr:truncated LAGLIDADG endonuclease [Sclerotinia borealis]AIJ56793.1 truncated LAGLIDADG endonuclease [Sclerotinia borealis]